jgi:hypothetical protein
MIQWRAVNKSNLDSQFCFDVHKLLDESKYTWYVTEGYRSIARSNMLWDEYKHGIVLRDASGKILRDENGNIKRGKKGPRAAIGGLSAHNYGMAIDVVLDGDDVKPGLQMDWNTKAAGWLWLKATIWKHPRLHSGWSFGDWPHIERYRWRDYASWRKTYEDNLYAINHPDLFVGVGLPA